MTEQRCPKCGARQTAKYSDVYECGTMIDEDGLTQHWICSKIEAAYNRGREDERAEWNSVDLANMAKSIEESREKYLEQLKAATLPSDEDVDKFIYSSEIKFSDGRIDSRSTNWFQDGMQKMYEWLRTKAQGGEG